MFSGVALHWRVIVLLVALLVVMAVVGRCMLRESSPEPRSVGAATVGDAREVRPPSEEALLEQYRLSDRDLQSEGYLRDPFSPEEVPADTAERYAHTDVDVIGPPVPDGESGRFVFEVQEIIGPHSMDEALGRDPRPRSDERRGRSDDGEETDDAPLEEALQVVTLRGHVRNITRRHCRRLVFKASYRGDDGTIHATGEAIVRDVQAQSRRGSRFEVHLTEWPREIGSPRPEGFRLHELRSRWTY